jgi:hypothetical protein
MVGGWWLVVRKGFCFVNLNLFQILMAAETSSA